MLKLLNFRRIGKGKFLFIDKFVRIQILNEGKICFGNKVNIERFTLLKSSGGVINVGSNVFINENCKIVSHKNITIKDNVSIGPNVMIFDHDHDGNGGFISKDILIDENVWIGSQVIILKGLKIGRNSIIGAGSVITKDVSENSIMVGNPAKKIGVKNE
jgi:acetyltransferase-like isoleucine patch superfamily enzyme